MTKTTASTNTWQDYLVKIENFLDLYFGQKAPAIPANIKEMIVKFSPYISLIGILLMLPAILFAFGLSSLALPFAYMGGFSRGFHFSFGTLFSIVIIVLEALALPGLFKRLLSGWRLMYYASLVTVVLNILTLNLGSLIIGGAISFYILFQIKALYR